MSAATRTRGTEAGGLYRRYECRAGDMPQIYLCATRTRSGFVSCRMMSNETTIKVTVRLFAR
jgi:hypothetical protein